MKKLFIVFILLLSATFAGCGNQNAQPSTAPKSTPQKVVVYMPSPAGLADKLAADFETKTGIKVEQFQGTTGEISARLETEQANPIADVVILASWSDGLTMKKKGRVLAYTPQNSDKIIWKDQDNMLWSTSASAVGVIYNTKIFPALSADWGDLSRPEYKNQLVIPDPEKSGACKDFLAGYINANGEDAGWQTLLALAQNGMTVPGANKAALEAVTTGEKGILVAGVDYNAYAAKAKGEPLDIYYPAGGTVVNPRPAMILKTSPNMANAKAFMDYLASPEAQKLVANAYLLPGRNDITTDKRTAITNISQLKYDWEWMMNHSAAIAAKLNKIAAKGR